MREWWWVVTIFAGLLFGIVRLLMQIEHVLRNIRSQLAMLIERGAGKK